MRQHRRQQDAFACLTVESGIVPYGRRRGVRSAAVPVRTRLCIRSKPAGISCLCFQHSIRHAGQQALTGRKQYAPACFKRITQPDNEIHIGPGLADLPYPEADRACKRQAALHASMSILGDLRR